MQEPGWADQKGAAVGVPRRRGAALQRVRLHRKPRARRPAAVSGRLRPGAGRRRLRRLRRCRGRQRHHPRRLLGARAPQVRGRRSDGAGHCRRAAARFDNAAAEAVALARQLYAVEREATGLDPAARLALRQARSPPVLAEMRGQLARWQTTLLPRHPMAEAVGCALNQWPELSAFAYDGAVPIDNNASEREIKRVVLNRKNSLFVGNPRGGRTAATPPASPPHAAATPSTRNSTSPSCWSTCPPGPRATSRLGCPTSGSSAKPPASPNSPVPPDPPAACASCTARLRKLSGAPRDLPTQ
ncbi:MAG TPA: transposase [Terriglobales bacterium]|nr:transposase [Terriglobales bacterium]